WKGLPTRPSLLISLLVVAVNVRSPSARCTAVAVSRPYRFPTPKHLHLVRCYLRLVVHRFPAAVLHFRVLLQRSLPIVTLLVPSSSSSVMPCLPWCRRCSTIPQPIR